MRRSIHGGLIAAVLLGIACTGGGSEGGAEGVGDWSSRPGDVDAGWKEIPLAQSEIPGAFFGHVSPSRDGALLSWWTPLEEEGGVSAPHRLQVAQMSSAGRLGRATTVVEGDDFFVNWADFPSITEVGPGQWVAHWLQRNGTGTYAYGVRVSSSDDGGASWSPPWTPHGDGTATEHGFVSILPHVAPGSTTESATALRSFNAEEGDWTLSWLDGRRYADGPGGPAAQEMQLRIRSVRAGTPGPEVAVDLRTCDCCQTAMAMTGRGPVVVYRDRSEGEIRDIYIARWMEGGWTAGAPVHRDGWEIAGCPVNGPAIAAAGDTVAVAWFTGAGDDPRVLLAWSTDAGASFGSPVRLDGRTDTSGRDRRTPPVGRVDVHLLAGGQAAVLWMDDLGGEGQVVLTRVDLSGSVSQPHPVGTTAAARASGFPRMASLGPGRLLVLWNLPAGAGMTRSAPDDARPAIHLTLLEMQ